MAEKYYLDCSLQQSPELFNGDYQGKVILTDILDSLSRSLGFRYEFYKIIEKIDKSAAKELVLSMSKHSGINTICFIVVDEEIVGYSLEESKYHVLNSDFVKRSTSLIEFESDLEIVEEHHSDNENIASILVKKKTPINVDIEHKEKDTDHYPYELGMLIVNDELNNIYTRLVVFIDNNPVYLPANIYNATNTRYRKSTSNAAEALEVLILKVKDDLLGEGIKYKLTDFHRRYMVNKKMLISYEEYNSLVKTMKKIPTIIEDDFSVLSKLLANYTEFERKYSHMEEQKSSYIWRCTAKSDELLGNIVIMALKSLKESYAPMMECTEIRELLGYYLSTPRILESVAQENI